MNDKIIFSMSRIEQLPRPPEGKRPEYHDLKQPGLRLRVTANGTKTFSVVRRVKHGEVSRITIGKFPGVSVEQARKKAAALVAEIEAGANPAQAKRVLRAEPSFEEALAEFLPAKRKRNGALLADKTRRDYADLVRLHFGSLRQRKLSAITRADVVRLRDSLRATSLPLADKAVRIISSVYNFMIDGERYIGKNPAKRVTTSIAVERERYVEDDEMPKLLEALADLENETMQHFFLLALFTGVRRGNLCSARWRDVSIEGRTLHLPRTKNGSPQTVQLTLEACEVLAIRRSVAAQDAEFVFPGNGKDGHMVAPSKAWSRVCEAAGLTNLRIHDLRRTLGSWMANNNVSLHGIGKVLGHKSQRSTAIYARIAGKRLQTFAGEATQRMVPNGWSAMVSRSPLAFDRSDTEGEGREALAKSVDCKAATA